MESDAPLPASPVRGYELCELIGLGGMGHVYRAHSSISHPPELAVKFLAWSGSSQLAERFRFEAETLRRLSHPNIARIFDHGQTAGGVHFMAMEFIEDAKPITVFCDDRGLTVRARIELFLQACDATRYAHQHGIIHRDLKPSNVLIGAGDPPSLRVIDFGIARDAARDGDGLTRTGDVLGSLHYMSPEQAAGRKVAMTIDTRADVYSLGVVLFELLSGELPAAIEKPQVGERFSSRSEERKAEAARYRSTSVEGLLELLSGPVGRVCSKAVTEDREERYGSVQEFADDLRRWLGGEAVAAVAPDWWLRSRNLIRRHRVLIGALAVAVLGLFAGLVVALSSLGESRGMSARLGNLAVRQRLESLRAQAMDMLPLDRLDRSPLVDWVRRGEEIVHRLPELRKAHELLTSDGSADREYRMDLEDVITSVEAFAVESPVPSEPTLPNVRRWLRRVERADALTYATTEARELWAEAIARIAASERYGGLRIQPQVNLRPLGFDRRSQLAEFGDAMTGALPTRDSEGRLEIGEASCVVFVLLPRGEVDGAPVGPLFVSKYEITQAQWIRFTGSNPSAYRPGEKSIEQPVTLLHPVTDVSWIDARRALGRLGHELPSMLEFEFAYDGGETTVYFTGNHVDSLKGYANIRDAAHVRRGGGYVLGAVTWSDGYVVHAPIGTFDANGFGLHDMAGNVSEYCRDQSIEGSRLRNALGGGWEATHLSAQPRNPRTTSEKQGGSALGIRPVRRLDQEQGDFSARGTPRNR